MVTSKFVDPCVGCRHLTPRGPFCLCPSIPAEQRVFAWFASGALGSCPSREPVAPPEPAEAEQP